VDKRKRPHFRKATLLRQRQPLTHFTDRIEDSKFEDYGQFLLGLKPTARSSVTTLVRGTRLCVVSRLWMQRTKAGFQERR
jgi:hypothetical protein